MLWRRRDSGTSHNHEHVATQHRKNQMVELKPSDKASEHFNPNFDAEELQECVVLLIDTPFKLTRRNNSNFQRDAMRRLHIRQPLRICNHL